MLGIERFKAPFGARREIMQEKLNHGSISARDFEA
jgi:hypothetical protein